jgi:glutamate dehydrogenase/leucine dehydrogenase
MKQLLKTFEKKQPEIVFEWSDPESEAQGWIVINSLRGGAAGGGTRMRIGLDKNEVESLAKTMEIKFTVSGPQIGGAKSGINFDPKDPRKKGVLERWYRAVSPILKNYYGTGGDLNVDEIHEVIPITESLGLWHPQEGVVNGHFSPPKPQKIHMIGRLRQGVSKIIEDQDYIPTSDKKYTLADMITGFGVAESVKHYYHLWGDDIATKTAIIQGWGNVGATAALYLTKYGVKIVGIIDKAGGLLSSEGMGLDEIKNLYYARNSNQLVSNDLLDFESCNQQIWDVGADIFIPAAASRLVTNNQSKRMIESGLEVVASGANVPFQDTEIFYGPIAEMVDKQVALIPDFIANCGMARAFAYFMEPENDRKITDKEIFQDISTTILNALKKVHKINPQKNNIAESAFKIALETLI